MLISCSVGWRRRRKEECSSFPFFNFFHHPVVVVVSSVCVAEEEEEGRGKGGGGDESLLQKSTWHAVWRLHHHLRLLFSSSPLRVLPVETVAHLISSNLIRLCYLLLLLLLLLPPPSFLLDRALNEPIHSLTRLPTLFYFLASAVSVKKEMNAIRIGRRILADCGSARPLRHRLPPILARFEFEPFTVIWCHIAVDDWKVGHL